MSAEKVVPGVCDAETGDAVNRLVVSFQNSSPCPRAEQVELRQRVAPTTMPRGYDDASYRGPRRAFSRGLVAACRSRAGDPTNDGAGDDEILGDDCCRTPRGAWYDVYCYSARAQDTK